MTRYARSCLLVLFVDTLSPVVDGVIKKARVCVQYEINDYKSSARRCDAFTSVSKTAWFVECLRHQHCSCGSFQFNSLDGLCEILENEECMVENKTPGVTFVGVFNCKTIPPWQSTEPANGKWRWVTDPPTRKGSVRLSSPGFVTPRAFHKGLFLAGSFTSGRLTTLRPSGGKLQCTSNIQFLIFENSFDYRWKNFYVGDPIPFTAIISGYCKDGTPLYIVKTTERPYGTLRAQIYKAKSLRVYPIIPKIKPEMKILIAV